MGNQIRKTQRQAEQAKGGQSPTLVTSENQQQTPEQTIMQLSMQLQEANHAMELLGAEVAGMKVRCARDQAKIKTLEQTVMTLHAENQRLRGEEQTTTQG
jgi:molecular chaperone GrpE (heat shock protein)